MDGVSMLVLAVLGFCSLGLAVQAVIASKDRARALRDGESVGSLWHHMMRLHTQREAARKAQRQNGRAAVPTSPAASKPKPLNNTQLKALGLPTVAAHESQPTRAIRTGWQLCEVAFMYEDANGDVTSRVVTVHWVGDSTFKGECHDRQAERTFRLDRVLGDITDTETGEMLEPEEWADEYR